MTEEKKPDTVFINVSSKLLANARKLRRNKTDAEDLLWRNLRNRNLNGLKFRRQHPLPKGFILDFFCPEKRIAIELDGKYHLESEQKEYDAIRTEELKEYEITVLRFWNEEVLKDVKRVTQTRSVRRRNLI
jgi:very-short-patch-repair endonuclease